MNPSELYRAGKLGEAIEAQILEVKAAPADPAKRLFLFELLAFAGDLDRARRQLQAINYGDLVLDTGVAAFGKLIEAEEARRKLFSDGLAPGFLGEPSEHLRLRLDAVNRLREGRPDEAVEAIARANELMPHVSGELNGRRFESLRDADDLFAGVLEVVALGRYYWVGLEQVERLTIEPPKYPRDLLFLPAQLELADQEGDVHLPVLYPDSHSHAEDGVKLGRASDWKEIGGGLMLGVGPHTYLLDDDAIGLLEWRELWSGREVSDTVAAGPEAAEPETAG